MFNFDHVAHRCELGITIGDKSYWGRGYGTDAVRLLIDYGFRHHNLYRICLSVNSTNPRAIGAYRRCCFVEEGRLRDHRWNNGQYIDLVQMGILCTEWQTLREGAPIV